MGSDEPDSLTKQTIALAKSPAAKEKAIRMFEKTPFVFRIIFWNDSVKGDSTFARSTGMPVPNRFGATIMARHGDITNYNRNRYGYDWPDTKELEQLVAAYKHAGGVNKEKLFFQRMGFGGGYPPQAPAPHIDAFDQNNEIMATSSMPRTPEEVEARIERYRQQGYRAMVVQPTKQEINAYKSRMAKWNRYKRFFDMAEKSGTDLWSTMDKPTGIAPVEGEITFVINSNHGSDFYPFTPWMIAHRFGHAIAEGGTSKDAAASPAMNTALSLFQTGIRGIITDVLDPIYIRNHPSETVGILNTTSWESGILAQIGKFKSARDLTFGDFGEFFLDCFAQYLIQGRVSFNPIQDMVFSTKAARFMSRRPGVDRRTGERDSTTNLALTPEDQAKIDAGIARLEDMLNDRFEQILQMCVGRVLVT